MALVLNEDQQLLKDSAQAFCQENAPISMLRRLRDSKDAEGFDRDLWQQMVALGWSGMAIPETYGGFAFGYGGLGVVLEETGHTLVSSPLIPTVLLGATLINELGNEAQKEALLPRIVAGELLLALALDEHQVHAPTRIATTARATGAGFVLDGNKLFVLDGHVADQLIVVARSAGAADSRDGISVFLIPADTAGVTITRTWMVDSRNSATVVLQNVEVPASALLGEVGSGYAGLEKSLDIARIGLAAEMLGSMEETFARILDYLKQREQFGVLIGSFQGLQHRAATMYSEIELCKSVVRAALAALDDPATTASEIARFASLAKAKLSEVAALVSNEGIQMHGGIGMTDEFDIGFFLKRARVAQQFLGDELYHRDRYAALSGF